MSRTVPFRLLSDRVVDLFDRGQRRRGIRVIVQNDEQLRDFPVFGHKAVLGLFEVLAFQRFTRDKERLRTDELRQEIAGFAQSLGNVPESAAALVDAFLQLRHAAGKTGKPVDQLFLAALHFSERQIQLFHVRLDLPGTAAALLQAFLQLRRALLQSRKSGGHLLLGRLDLAEASRGLAKGTVQLRKIGFQLLQAPVQLGQRGRQRCAGRFQFRVIRIFRQLAVFGAQSFNQSVHARQTLLDLRNLSAELLITCLQRRVTLRDFRQARADFARVCADGIQAAF